MPSSCFLCRVSGLLAPILAEVLYEKGPVWPLAAFVPSMALVAIASGKFISQRKLVRCTTRRSSPCPGVLNPFPSFTSYLCMNALTRVHPLGMPLSLAFHFREEVLQVSEKR